ncbi:mitotic-spindle organizing gamma-tubulin ring associated-domain-containing protein, partial [Chaetomium sp. MPI-CAGE-AT-0009]
MLRRVKPRQLNMQRVSRSVSNLALHSTSTKVDTPTKMPPNDRAEKQAAAQQAVNILHEISTILNCHLDRQTLSICISMIEKGINPEALADVVKELRKQGQESQLEAAAAAAASSAAVPSRRR